MFGRQKELMRHVEDFMEMSELTLLKFYEAMEYNLEHGSDAHFEVLVAEISEKEQNCDELRRGIEHELFSQSLLPETREDLLEIIERMDAIPNHCENVSNMIMDQNTVILPVIRADVMELLRTTREIFRLVIEAVKDCFGKMNRITALASDVDRLRDKSNCVRRRMIRAIFTDEQLLTHPGGQLIQKQIVAGIDGICNKCKHLMEKITITAIKRKV